MSEKEWCKFCCAPILDEPFKMLQKDGPILTFCSMACLEERAFMEAVKRLCERKEKIKNE